MAGNPTLPTENIDEVILGLLSLEPNEIDELDYETYKSYLKELLSEVWASKRKIGGDEAELIRNEFKRVRGKKGRFRLRPKKTKISASGLGLGGIRKQVKGTQKRLMLAPAGGVPKSQEKIETISKKGKENPLLKISETLDSILNTLIDIGRQDAKEKEKNRRSEEEKRRTGREKSLESKTFDGLKKAISTVIQPFQSIWDRLVNFIFYTFLGKVVIKLFDWFADRKNQDKVKSLIRFIKDWWPALLGSYILFGTKFGGLIRFVGGWAVRLAVQLGKVVIPRLLSFIAKNPFAALAIASGIGAYAATQQNKERRDESAKTDPSIVKPEQTAKTGRGPGPIQLSEEQIGQRGLGQAFSGGGSVRPRLPAFRGGGLNFKGMIAASHGRIKNLSGYTGGSQVEVDSPGLVKGPGGPKGDKIPALLSNNEFVMSAGAVNKYGVDTFERMNAEGGGTNRPKMVGGTTYAAGGGLIGDKEQWSTIPGGGDYFKKIGQDQANIDLRKNLQNQQNSFTKHGSGQKHASGSRKITVNGINVTGLQGLKGLRGMGPNVTITRDTGMTPEMQAKLAAENKRSAAMDASRANQEDLRKKARAEYNKIINNPDDPRYQAAWDGKLKISDLQKQLQSTSPAPVATKPTAPKPIGYTPYQSRFAGARDAAFTNPRGLGGFTGVKSSDFYKANSAAKEKSLSKLSSQQRLNVLSREGAGPKSKGIRYTAEALAARTEWDKRGGDWGGFTRGLTRLFTATPDKINAMRAEDKASEARVKQAGAASIGRYYSSSDGKYYKDYNAAKLAHDQRKKSGVKPPVKPKPKVYHSTGGGSNPAGSAKKSGPPTHPSFSASHGKTNTAKKTLGVK